MRLHYVPGGQGSHVSDNRDQNGINVSQRSLKICHGSHGGSEKRNGS